ncbi:Aegerolysin [Polyporus arcularius HHB13444]|uniref:Aegerolysin n=1 Tax=Polyporus arcularius HHB13444 TaxID=1314778 RepID=A0A5C3PC84_9APHY|nr:Aegerolysin [Polyporus arcularius HHB13444]
MSQPAEATTEGLKAISQWVNIYLENNGNKDMKLQSIELSYGHLYSVQGRRQDRRGRSVRVQEPPQLVLKACGKWGSNTGTTGEFSLVDPAKDDKRIRHFYFDSPYNESMNTWTISGTNDEWMIQDKGVNLGPGGTLGTIFVEIMNKPAGDD